MSSLTGWVEAMVFFALGVGLITIIFAGMNTDYNENYNIGINTTSIEDNLKSQTSDGQSQILGGEANSNANSDAGLLSTSIGILTGSASMIWTFVTGGWIEQIISFLNLGVAGSKLAIYLRIFWSIGVVFAIAYAIFKVRT